VGGDPRIVSLAPNVTETLFALGVGDQVVGVTKFCNYPKQAESIEKVGGLVDPDLERILSLNPTLIVGVRTEQSQRIDTFAEGKGIDVVWVTVETLDDVYGAIAEIGRRVKREQRAREVVESMKRDLAATERDEVKRGIVLFGTEPYVAAGPDTFADTLLRRAGAVNALGADSESYAQLDLEKLIVLDPDFVITMGSSQIPTALRAAKEGRVFRFPDPDVMRPGPRLGEALSFFNEVVAK
jgi:iron complex transport system substrate-binding protein